MTDAPIDRVSVELRKVALPAIPMDDDDELIFSRGVDYAIMIVAEMIGVHPDEFSWDAATEEFEGDVRAVIGNMLNVVSEYPLRAALDAETARADRAEAAAELFGGANWKAKADYDTSPAALKETDHG